MNLSRVAQNSRTLLSWSLRRDSFKPSQCFIDKQYTIPKGQTLSCDCIKYCKHGPRREEVVSYSSMQDIDQFEYSVTPLKVPVLTKENIVMYL
jgi:hypothetical protein